MELIKAQLLIVDDNPENLRVLSSMLKQQGYGVRAAKNGKQAIESFQMEPPDLVLLDIQMPMMDGYEVCRRIKKQACYRLIPIIFISAMEEAFNKAMAFEAGGSDYITKPIQAEEVLARVKTHLNLYKYQKELKNKNFELLQQFKATFEQAAVGIAHIDMHTGFYLKVNQRFADMLGYCVDELLKKTIEEITHPDFYERDAFKIEQLKRKEIDFFVREKKYLTAEGLPMWCKITMSLVAHQQESRSGYLLLIIEDISKTKEMERAQKENERLISQMQRMEAIGTLAGGIAHDFNNILSAIIGYTEIALTEATKGSMLEKNLLAVCSAGQRATDLVKQILTVARQPDKKRSVIQPKVITKEVLKFIRSTTPTFIKITHKIDSDASIMADATQIHQLLMNLCTNAIQAMEDSGGELHVSIKDVFFDNRNLLIDMKPGPYIEIKVSDTGGGIAPESIDLIFDPYFTTKGPGEGTGLGLATVHGIVKNCKGKIQVVSQPGKGTKFTIHLPVSQNLTEKKTKTPEKLPSGQEKILVVDDEATIAKMVGSLLESLGYSVTAKSNGIEALELFKERPDDFDLILSDITMPDITGDKLAMEVMKIRPDIPIVLCTGYSKLMSKEDALKLGIRAFIHKPFTLKDLAQTIRKALD